MLIILASGEVMAGSKGIETKSGTYTPLIIDFTQRDGERRLQEIREAVEAGTFEHWMELMFVPLYGTLSGLDRARLVEEVIHFEKTLYDAQRISQRLLAATLVMSNKLIDKARLYELWEEVRMLDILEIAEEKGLEKGLKQGLEQGMEQGKTLGMIAAMQDLLIDTLLETCGIAAGALSQQIRGLNDRDLLKGLHREAIKCRSAQDFEAILHQVSPHADS